MQDRQLWERAFKASVNGAVIVEEAVEPAHSQQILEQKYSQPAVVKDLLFSLRRHNQLKQ